MSHSHTPLLRAAPLTFALLWSSGFVVAKFAATGAEPLTFLCLRYAGALLVLAAIAVAMRASWPTHPRVILHSVVAGVLLHGLYLGGVWWAVARGLPAGLSGLIAGAQPLITALLAGPLLGERLTLRHWAGVLVGLAGIVLVLLPRLMLIGTSGLGPELWPILVNFAAMLSVTAGTFYQKRFAVGADLRTGTVLQYVGALLVTVPAMLLLESMHFEPTPTVLGALIWSVLVVSVAAIALLMLLIRLGAVSRVATLIYLVPPLAALQAFVLFDETLTPVQIAGMAVAAFGVWLATRASR